MNAIGKLLGEKTHTHTSAAHTHTVAAHGHTVNNSNAYNSGGPSNNTSGGPSNNTSGSTTLTAAQSGVGSHTHTIYDGSRADQISFCGFYAPTGTTMRYKPAINGLTDNVDACLKNTYTSANASQGHTHTLSSHTHSLQSHTHSIGAHNHGLTTTALTTNSTTPGSTGSSSNFQPTMVLNWIVKAVMLIPEYFIVENTLTSTSTSNALSAAQGKILNNKINSLSTVASTGSYNDLVNKPERVDYISQITCNYGTLNSNFNYCFLKDDVVYLNLTYTLNTALTAGTQYDFCKIPAAIRPKGNVIMYAFSHTVSHMITNYVRSTGELVIAPEKAIPAGKEINMWTVYYIK
jgi:hypothetical protein